MLNTLCSWCICMYLGVMAIQDNMCKYYRVCISGRQRECPWFGYVPTKELRETLNINCDICMLYFKEILGSSSLCLRKPHVFLPSHILSHFFMVVTNLLQDLTLVEYIADMLGFGMLIDMEAIKNALCEYVLTRGEL